MGRVEIYYQLRTRYLYYRIRGPGMVECWTCGVSLDNLAYTCNYCGQSNCSEHRLPENHDCVALHLTRPPESSEAEADAYTAQRRDFRTDSNFVDRVEAFRDENVPDGEPEDDAEEVFRETLEGAGVNEADAEGVAENVAEELSDPGEKPYSVFEPELTVGTQPAPEYESSPDVAPDGSVGAPETSPPSEMEDGTTRRRGYSPFVIIISGTVLALILLFVLFIL